jgi:hypothetical protein
MRKKAMCFVNNAHESQVKKGVVRKRKYVPEKVLNKELL